MPDCRVPSSFRVYDDAPATGTLRIAQSPPRGGSTLRLAAGRAETRGVKQRTAGAARIAQLLIWAEARCCRQYPRVNAALRTAPTSPVVGEIVFSRGELHRGYFSCTASVEANGEVWTVDLEMIEPYRADMLGFFEEIARSARRGWEGGTRWESEYSEFHLDAYAKGDGEVALDVYMRWPPTYDEERQTRMMFAVEAVERYGERMRGFLRMERGRRWRRLT